MKEKYSVLMSLYIKEKPENFKLSIESILNQTVLPDQIVIVEDGELTIELSELVNEYSKKYSDMITNVVLEKNIGLGLALNEGIKKCDNELIGRMDTDDIALPERFEKQLKRFSEKDNLVLLGTQNLEFNVDHNRPTSQRKVPTNYDDIIKFSKRRSPFNHPTVMYKKSYIEKLGGYNDILRNEDYDLFYRILKEGYYAENLPDATLLFRTDIDNYKRRKSWVNCRGYIKVSLNMYQNRYISIFDLLYVAVSQVAFMLLPIPLLKIVSNKLLRSEINDSV